MDRDRITEPEETTTTTSPSSRAWSAPHGFGPDGTTTDEGAADEARPAFPPPSAGPGGPTATPPRPPGQAPAPDPTGPVITRPPTTGPVGPAPASPSPPPRSRRRRGATFAIALLSGVLGALATVGLLVALGYVGRAEVTPTPTDPNAAAAARQVVVEQNPVTITPEADDVSVVTAVAAKVIPSIVTVEIDARTEEEVEATADTAPDFIVTATGSGVIFDEQAGHLVTNNHVIEEAREIRVVLSDGRIYPADLVGTDPLTDIAVLQVDGTGLAAVDFADIDTVRIGDLAVAIGNPLGLEGGPSVTSGVVSAFNRSLQVGAELSQRLYGLLQTDAPITRGSSGGGLFDAEGRLIGVTTAIGVSDVGAEGLGFAVPVDMTTRVIDEILEKGKVEHAFLGVTATTAFEEAEDGAAVPIGAQIVEFFGDSAIRRAGAQEGDVITAIDGIPMKTIDDLIAYLRKRRAGDEVTVSVLREGRPVTLRFALGVRPDDI